MEPPTDSSALRAALSRTAIHGNAAVMAALADTVPSVEPLRLAGALPSNDEALRSVEPSAVRFCELGELGQGGLGVVVEAFDQDLQRVVAVKRPRDDRLSPRTIAALTEEAQITAQLDHPNVPAVHGMGIDAEGRPFFTMTRLRGAAA